MRPDVETMNDTDEGEVYVNILFGTDMEEAAIRSLLSIDCVETVAVKVIDSQNINVILKGQDGVVKKEKILEKKRILQNLPYRCKLRLFVLIHVN